MQRVVIVSAVMYFSASNTPHRTRDAHQNSDDNEAQEIVLTARVFAAICPRALRLDRTEGGVLRAPLS